MDKIGDKKNKKKKVLIILLIIIFVLLIVGFLIYKIFISGKVIITIKDGDEITKIEATYGYDEKLVPKEKEGYKFNYYEVDGQIFNIDKLVLESIVIKPIYIKEDADTSKVTFVIDEFLESKNINVEFVKGKNIVLPTIPFKEGYIFSGWKDSKGNIIHNGFVVTEDLTILPAWEENKGITSNGVYTCEHFNEECEIGDDNKCHCKKRDNALVKSYACKEGSTYNEEEKKCITKEEIAPTCSNGTYEESLGGCKITTNMVETCAQGYLIEGKCYYNEYDNWIMDYSCNGYLFANIYEKCFREEANTIMTCPTGYTRESNSCYKIESPSYCNTDYELKEENGHKLCIQKSEKLPVFSCNEDYTLENYTCVKKYVTSASKL